MPMYCHVNSTPCEGVGLIKEERIFDGGIRSFCCAPGMTMNYRVKDANPEFRKPPARFRCSDMSKIY